MPPYKRMENRKYNQDEIKAFKKDHAKYWGNRDFTKKQAAYIRSCYKVPWGSIKPHKGPIPRFSESPKVGTVSGPNLTAQQNEAQAARPSEVDAADNYLPTGSAQQQRPQDLRAVAVDPGIQGQNLAFNQTSLANDTNKMAIDPFLLQPNGGSAEDPFDLDAFATGMAPGDFDFVDFSNLDYDSFDFSNLDPVDNAPQGSNVNQQAGGGSNGNQALAAIRAQLCGPSPDLSGLADFGTSSPSAFGGGSGMNLGGDFGQNFDGADPIDILAKLPGQPVEQQQQQQQQQPVNAGAQGLQPSQLVQSIEPAQAASETQIPLGYTAEAAALRDPRGVWYYGPHDQCQIARTHRHDTDGGVYFASELGVYQTFLHMRKQEGIGFLLGMAAAQMAQGPGHALGGWRGAAEIARGTLMGEEEEGEEEEQEEEENGQVRTGVAAPKPEIAERLAQINSQLPPAYYYEPFTNRIVQYTLPPGSALRNGGQGNNAAGSPFTQPPGHSGGPTQ